jgi:mRNA interferase MazF
MFNQFDIYWVDLNPTRGAETQKKRPCVIIQSSILNQNSRTVIVAPLLPDHKDWPFVVNITPSTQNNLDKPRNLNLKQMRAVDVSRLSNHYGVIEHHYKSKIQTALDLIFDYSD